MASSAERTAKADRPTSRQISPMANSEISNSNATEKDPPKKIPPIKAPVGLAKGPDLKNCKSKVGSLNNIGHTPKGSGVQIQSHKLKWNAKSKVGSLDNKEHKPGGGNLKVESRKLDWKTTSKVQSLQNVHHKPGGGNIKIFNESYMLQTSAKDSGSDEETESSNDVKTGKSNQLEKKLQALNIS